MSTPDMQHDTIFAAHLKQIEDALHELQHARKHGTLTPAALRSVTWQFSQHAIRDFPDTSAHVQELSQEDVLTDYWQRIKTCKGAAPTGIGGLNDALNGGLQGKRLVVLLGAPGSGKTSLANQIAEHVADTRPVLYVTSEDAPDVLVAKTIARVGKIKYSAALHGWESYRTQIDQTCTELAARPSGRLLRYLDMTASVLSLAELRERARAHLAEKPAPGLIVVDYLQRMARVTREMSGMKELREAVTLLTEQLRAIANELECTVLALASMNRASGYGKSSDVSALASAKESGDIEYTADVIMALTEDSSNRRATSDSMKPRILRLDKNRIGVTTTIELDWWADRQQFIEAEKSGGRR